MTSRRPGAHPHATRLVHLGRKAPDSKACARGPWSARSFRFTPTSQPRRLVSALQPWLPCRSVSPFPWSAPSRARARNVRTSAISAGAPRVAPGVASRAVLGLNRRPVRGALASSSASANRANPRSLGHRPDRGMPPGARLPGLPDSDRTPRPAAPIPQISPRRFMFPLTRRVRSRPSARSSASAHAHPSAFACSSATSLNPAFLHPTPHARSTRDEECRSS